MRPRIRRPPHHAFPRFEDRAHERQLKKVLVARGRQSRGGRRQYRDAVAFDDLVCRHESIEHLVALIRVDARDASVSPPGRGGVRCVDAERNAGAGGQAARHPTKP